MGMKDPGTIFKLKSDLHGNIFWIPKSENHENCKAEVLRAFLVNQGKTVHCFCSPTQQVAMTPPAFKAPPKIRTLSISHTYSSVQILAKF